MSSLLAPVSLQFLRQLSLISYVQVLDDQSAVSFKLVPTSGWHGSREFPYEVKEDLKHQGFKTIIQEGIEYYLVPDETTNTPGILSHYARRTGVKELQNAPGGGVNRIPDSIGQPDVTAAPDAVAKYVKTTDNEAEAQKVKEEDAEVIKRAIKTGTGEKATAKTTKGKKNTAKSK